MKKFKIYTSLLAIGIAVALNGPACAQNVEIPTTSPAVNKPVETKAPHKSKKARAQHKALPPVVYKPLLQGLISSGNTDFHHFDNQEPDNSLKYIYAKPGILDGVVLNFSWAQLEPRPDVVTTKVIDQALANVRAYNKKYPKTPLAVRLRIYAGPSSPDWVKRLGGKFPVKIQYRGEALTIGRFWSVPYGHAWRHLQDELAKKYDINPLIREVSMTSCSSVTSEPFVFAGGPVSLEKMHDAGFSDGRYRECLTQAFKDYKVWRNTRVEFAFTPYRISDSGDPDLVPQHTLQVMRVWRKKMGQGGVLSNHSLQSPTPNQLRDMFEAMKVIGGPLEFQLNTLKGLDLDAGIQYGVTLGATAIEIPPDTFTNLERHKLEQWSVDIKHIKNDLSQNRQVSQGVTGN